MDANSSLHSHSDLPPLIATLKARIDALEQALSSKDAQLQWFKRQIFGPKSERHVNAVPDEQIALFAKQLGVDLPSKEKDEHQQIQAHQRKKHRSGNEVLAQGLRFDDNVPVKQIDLPCEALQGPDADHYEVIGYKDSYRLASQPGSSYVLHYRRAVVKRKDDGTISQPHVPEGVLGQAQVDVSFLAQALVDKFCYHTPLYRQCQKLQDHGITISRSTLDHWVRQSLSLLTPIAQAVKTQILEGTYIKVDETTIKAGRKKNAKGKGKMKTGWMWPILGEHGDIAFCYHPKRDFSALKEILGEYHGTLQSDGYEVYAQYAKSMETLVSALCWSHTRRGFEKAQASEPEAVGQILSYIQVLYRIERQLRQTKADNACIKAQRQKRSRRCVDKIFKWIDQQRQRPDLLPKSLFAKALRYAGEREAGLRVFLSDPNVDLDTNDLERALRVIPMGRKNWLFCSSEVGAEHVATIQTLLATCRVHDVNPYRYLVDVLQRIDRHQASQVHELTPREWKKRFADNPLRAPGDG